MKKLYVDVTAAVRFPRSLPAPEAEAAGDNIEVSFAPPAGGPADVHDTEVRQVKWVAPDCLHLVARLIILIDEGADLEQVMAEMSYTVLTGEVTPSATELLGWVVVGAK